MSKYVVAESGVTARRSRFLDALPYVIGIVLIVLGIFFGLVANRMLREHTSFGDAVVGQMLNVPAPAAVFGKDRIYVLMLGIDYNYDDKGQPYSKDARSDTIMVAGLDFPTKSMHLVSVLRDTEAIVNGHDTKINEAYSVGGERLSDQVVGDFLGMPDGGTGHHFDRYVIVKINAIKDFVNAIGGIDVPVTETMDYDDNWGHLHIHFKPGLYHMNGEQAQGYMRFRHDACSDPCRTKRQQQVIQLVIHKLKTDKLNDFTHLGSLIDVMHKDIITDMTTDEEKSLGWAFKNAQNADLAHADTIGYVDTKETPWAGEVLIPDEKQKERLVAQLLGPYGNVTPAPAAAIAAIAPASIHVTVENGSGITGLAAAGAARLRKLGYVIDGIANADGANYEVSEIRPEAGKPLVGERVRADLGVTGATVTPATDATPGPATRVIVVLGRDFAQASVGAPATPSTAPR